MSVITEFQISSTDFELGRILQVKRASSIELETLVPVGDVTVPLFWVRNSTRESFVETVNSHPTVNDAAKIDEFEDRTLFTLDWNAAEDKVFRGLAEYDGHLLTAIGNSDIWRFEVRFVGHESFSEFTTYCESESIDLEVTRVYNPTKPDAGPWYGLTEPQREALDLAVSEGYYDIPRGCTTKELAAELGISDQAVTERLRRAIVSFVSNTLALANSDSASGRD